MRRHKSQKKKSVIISTLSIALNESPDRLAFRRHKKGGHSPTRHLKLDREAEARLAAERPVEVEDQVLSGGELPAGSEICSAVPVGRTRVRGGTNGARG